MGSVARGVVGADRRARGQRRRRAMDLRADGGHRARSAMGPHRGGRRRRPVVRLANGGGVRARISVRARLPRVRETLRGLRRRGSGPRLQHRRHVGAHAARDLPSAVSRGGRCRRVDADVGLRFAQWSSGDRESSPAHRHSSQRVGLQRIRGERLGCRRSTA